MLAEAKQQKLAFNTTIEAQITNVDNASIGQYEIEYQKSKFYAYTDNTSITYKIDETVYVSVPNGNLTNKKIILARKDKSSSSFISVVDPSQKVDEVGIPFDQIYSYQVSEIGIPGYYSELYSENWLTIFQHQDTATYQKEDSVFKSYAKNQTGLKIQASFKTNFDISKKIDKGDYGILVTFGTSLQSSDGNYIKRSYYLNTENMTGNAYTNVDYSQQTVYLQIAADNLTYLDSIKLYSKDFKHYFDDEVTQIPDASLVDSEIFVSNINLQFVKEIEAENGYSANILTPDGIYLNYIKDDPSTPTNEELRLVPQFKYNGIEIPDSNYEVYWFLQDNSILNTDDSYSIYGGKGWRLLTPNADKVLYQENFMSYFGTIGTFKLVVVYKDSIIRESLMTIYYNEFSDEAYYIAYSRDESGLITLQALTTNEDAVTKRVWMSKDANGVTTQINLGEKKEDQVTLVIESKTIETSCIYYCSYYNNKQVLATKYYLVTQLVNKLDVTVTFDTFQQGLFSYDENGYINIDDYKTYVEKNPLTFSIYFKDGQQSDYKYQWILPSQDDSLDISDNGLLNNADGYLPKNSMLEFKRGTLLLGDQSTSDKALYYNIKSYYNRKNTNNQIVLKITIEGEIYNFPFNFIFTKQGDLGTNGTDYNLYITPSNDGNGVFSNFIFKHNDSDPSQGSWQNNTALETSTQLNLPYVEYYIKLYKDGEPVALSKEDYTITCTIPSIYQPYCLLQDPVNATAASKVQNDILNMLYKKYDDPTTVYWGVTTSTNPNTITERTNEDYIFKDKADLKDEINTVKDTQKKNSNKYNFHYDLSQLSYGKIRFYLCQSFLSTVPPRYDSLNNFNYLMNVVYLNIVPKKTSTNAYKDFGIIAQIPIGVNTDTTDYCSNIPNIMYDNDGYNPTYSREALILNTYDNKEKTNTNYIYSVVSPIQNSNLITGLDQFTGAISSVSRQFDYKNAIQGIKITQTSSTLYFPVIGFTNYYSLKTLNGWDGISLDINSDNGTIFAPQIGAGEKDEFNRFNGVIMGMYDLSSSGSTNQTGLWGFQGGQQSFGFNVDGTAFIGREDIGGRIEFKTETGGIIKSSNFSESKQETTYLFGSSTNSDSTADNLSSLSEGSTIYVADMFTGSGNSNISSIIYNLVKGRSYHIVLKDLRYSYFEEGSCSSDVTPITKQEYFAEQDIDKICDSWTQDSLSVNRLFIPLGMRKKSNSTTATSSDGKTTTTYVTYNIPCYLIINNLNKTGQKYNFQIVEKNDSDEFIDCGISTEDKMLWKMSIYGSKIEAAGMQIQLTDGIIIAADFQLKTDWLTIDTNGSPVLKVGPYFYIDRDGNGKISGWTFNGSTLYSASGLTYLNGADGIITAEQINTSGGSIGGWNIRSNGFYSNSGEVYLSTSGEMQFGSGSYITSIGNSGFSIGNSMKIDSYGITIGSGNYSVSISTSGLFIKNKDSSTTINGYSIGTQNINIYTSLDPKIDGTSSLGYTGLVTGDNGVETTYNIGIEATQTDSSDRGSVIIKSVSKNIALRCPNGTIYLTAKKLNCDSVTSFSGIYATLA